MASITKRGRAWFAQVRRRGVSRSGSFSTKAEAVAWAAQLEAEILADKRGEVPERPFSDLLTRYRDEVSATKRGERWERLRIGLLLRDGISAVSLRDLDARHVAEWRDRRLGQVSAASVRREWNLLSAACNVAVREWRWLRDNPFREVRRPAPSAARDRIATDHEIERLLFALGYDCDTVPGTITARVGAAVLFAVETAMRAGEIAGLTWDRVFEDRRFVKVGAGKTAAARRDVPLSPEALRILKQMRPLKQDSVFDLTTQQIDALFRKAKVRAMVDDLHFHDLRHTAITRLSRKLDVLALARMVGHRDLRMLQVYYNESAEDLAGRL